MIDSLGYMVPIWKIPDWTSNDIIKYVKHLILITIWMELTL